MSESVAELYKAQVFKMAKVFPELVIWYDDLIPDDPCLTTSSPSSFIIVGSVLTMHLMTFVWRIALDGEFSDLSMAKLADQYSAQYAWLIKLCMNCFGYLTVIIPALLILKYTKNTKYFDRKGKCAVGQPVSSIIINLPAFSDPGCLSKVIRSCFYGSGEGDPLLPTSSSTAESESKGSSSKPKRTPYGECIQLTYCFLGLMVSFLFWGVLQEKIMTQEYVHMEGDKEVRVHFRESQFLVFVNRMLAFIIAGIYLWCHRKQGTTKRQAAPLYKFSISSIANVLSAWFQYEALKFVNFPTQVLAKSCKIIPVMIMGKIVSRNKYQFYEYIVAGLISVGMVLFMTGSVDPSKGSAVTTLTGVFLLCMYMTSDSFNSNWQEKLFKSYSMESVEMMFGVNMFSCLFTASSLFVQSGFLDNVEFAIRHPAFLYDCVLLSVCAAVGQLFIFHTISTFGSATFTIIMTLRQAIAILLSCLIYQHHVSFMGVFGILVVFLAVFLNIYCKHRSRRLGRNRAPTITDDDQDISPLIAAAGSNPQKS